MIRRQNPDYWMRVDDWVESDQRIKTIFQFEANKNVDPAKLRACLQTLDSVQGGWWHCWGMDWGRFEIVGDDRIELGENFVDTTSDRNVEG